MTLLNQFSPKLMRREIMRKRDTKMVFKNFLWVPDNLDASTKGQSITLPSIGRLTASSHADGTITYAKPDDQSQTLLIDKQVICPVEITNINNYQSVEGLYPAIAQEMGFAMANYQDRDLAQNIYKGAGVKVDLTSDGVDSGNIYDALMNLRAEMELNDVDELLPLFAHPYLAKAIALSNSFIKSNNDAVVASGVIGECAGFRIIKTNNLETTGTYGGGDLIINACAFTPNRSVAWVEQKGFEVKILEDKDFTSDFLRSHQIYGWKVVRASEVAHFKVKINIETSI